MAMSQRGTALTVTVWQQRARLFARVRKALDFYFFITDFFVRSEAQPGRVQKAPGSQGSSMLALLVDTNPLALAPLSSSRKRTSRTML